MSTVRDTLGGQLAVPEVLERFPLRALPKCPSLLEDALMAISRPHERGAHLAAVLAAWRARRAVEAGLAAGGVPALKALLEGQADAHGTDAASARTVAVWINRLIVLRHGWNPCFYHCSGMVAGLRHLGHDARLVLGHERFLLAGSPGPMHSWVEVGGTPIIDSPRTVNAYRVVLRLPRPAVGG